MSYDSVKLAYEVAARKCEFESGVTRSIAALLRGVPAQADKRRDHLHDLLDFYLDAETESHTLSQIEAHRQNRGG